MADPLLQSKVQSLHSSGKECLMKTKTRMLLPQMSAMKRLSRKPLIPSKRRTTAWWRGRQAPLQPWRRGRIRPSTCRDLREE